MKKIAVYGNSDQERWIPMIARFLQGLSSRGVDLYVNAGFSEFLQTHGVETCWRSVADFPEGMDKLVSLGGDGTFLHAAQWEGSAGVPVLGVNTGHLGYLSSYTLEDLNELTEAVCGESGKIEPRMMLKLESPWLPEGFWPYALNEVAILKCETASMVTVRTLIDGRYLADYKADGLIVATPTGSTAYNLSAGGPILEPMTENMVISPIASHSLTMRPLVIGGGSTVEASVACRAQTCRVSLDGRPFTMSCPPSEEQALPMLKITRGEFTVNVLHRPDSDFATILRNKLLWGRDTIG